MLFAVLRQHYMYSIEYDKIFSTEINSFYTESLVLEANNLGPGKSIVLRLGESSFRIRNKSYDKLVEGSSYTISKESQSEVLMFKDSEKEIIVEAVDSGLEDGIRFIFVVFVLEQLGYFLIQLRISYLNKKTE
jgi:hypothetical protein